MEWLDLVVPSAAILALFGVVALVVVAIRQGRAIRRLEERLARSGEAADEAPLQRIAELQARQRSSPGGARASRGSCGRRASSRSSRSPWSPPSGASGTCSCAATAARRRRHAAEPAGGHHHAATGTATAAQAGRQHAGARRRAGAGRPEPLHRRRLQRERRLRAPRRDVVAPALAERGLRCPPRWSPTRPTAPPAGAQSVVMCTKGKQATSPGTSRRTSASSARRRSTATRPRRCGERRRRRARGQDLAPAGTATP